MSERAAHFVTLEPHNSEVTFRVDASKNPASVHVRIQAPTAASRAPGCIELPVSLAPEQALALAEALKQAARFATKARERA